MNFRKTNPNITEQEFLKLVSEVDVFYSIKGREYQVNHNIQIQALEKNPAMLHIIRKSSKKTWSMDLTGVLNAYKNITDFKTKNFAPYVLSLTHSPSLGLLLHLKLLTRI